MQKIVAANNLTIRTEEGKWSLYNGRTDETTPIVQAAVDGLTYQPAFGVARRLSPDGHLPVSAIVTVVVGWAAEDSSWHLGVLVTPELAQTRGGRWCGLARWDDFDGDEAERAGAALATALDRPFRFVPPTNRVEHAVPDTAELEEEEEAPSTEPTVPPTPPMSLPISLDEWIVQEHPQGMIWERSGHWRTRTTLYGVMSVSLALVFGLLSMGAILSPYAPVQPEILPKIGLAIAVILVVIGVRQIFIAARALSVLIDNHQKLIRFMRGQRRTVLQVPYEGIQYVLVSHALIRRESVGKSKSKRLTGLTEAGLELIQPETKEKSDLSLTDFDRIWPEVWIHLYSPRRGFLNVCYIDNTEGRALSGLEYDERRPLNLSEIDSPPHHAALIMAEMIGVPAYVEER